MKILDDFVHELLVLWSSGDFALNIQHNKHFTVENSEFIKWVVENFPHVTEVKLFRRDGNPRIIGFTKEGDEVFSFRVTLTTTWSKEVLQKLWSQHRIQRIHVSEFEGDQLQWIKDNAPTTSYVHLSRDVITFMHKNLVVASFYIPPLY